MKIIKKMALILLATIFIQGCANNKVASSNFLNYQTKANLKFPLRGESLIVHGGREIEQNAHASEKDQRFAIDVVALKQGSTLQEQGITVFEAITYEGDPKQNDSYYIYGRDVIAPANGRIVDTLDGIPDAIPSETHYDYKHPAGNYVVIDHGNNEFSMLAHLKNGSVIFSKGDLVVAGDVIGSVGNTGNSTEPHLHYHLQNTSQWRNGEGLPAQFQNYIANGKFIHRGEPVRGQIIESK